ncbi:MAG TPA: hypothetical protein VNA14_13620 [Mycobacteriales bacterium]|nr:hypothetical protein [Mycobacteriales bacterium]
MNADDRLREILHAEAEKVETSPAAYDAIKTRFARSRRRNIWQRSMLATATLAAVAITAVVVIDPDGDRLVVDPPAATPSATPSAGPSPTESLGPVPSTDGRINAVWPYTTQAEIDAWTRTANSDLAKPLAAAGAFIRAFLGSDSLWATGEVREAEPRVVEVDIDRGYGDSSPPARVTTLTLRAYGESEADGPWLVTQALTPGITITAPGHGATVNSPLTMSGTVVGIHHSVHAQVRSVDGTSRGEAYVMAGESEPWSVSVGFTSNSTVSSVTATLRSDRDGLPTSFTAVPVRTSDPPKGPPPTLQPPETYVAIQDSRLALIKTTTGDRVRYLTTERPGGGVSFPEMAPDSTTVYFVRGEGTCAASIGAVSTTTLTERGVTKMTDVVPSLLSVSGDGKWLAYVRTKCAGDSPGDWSIVLRDLSTGAERSWSSSASAPESGGVVDLATNADGSTVYFLHAAPSRPESDPALRVLDTTAPGEVLEEHSTTWAFARQGCALRTVDVSTSYPDVVVACATSGSALEVQALAADGKRRTLFSMVAGGGLLARADFVQPGTSLVLCLHEIDAPGCDVYWWLPGSEPVRTAAGGAGYPTW